MIENELMKHYIDELSSSDYYYNEVTNIDTHMRSIMQVVSCFLNTQSHFSNYYNDYSHTAIINEFNEYHIHVLQLVLDHNSIEVSVNRALTPYCIKALHDNGFNSLDGVLFTRY